MKILVINGSPKGENSITLQTVLYLQKKNPQHTFEVIHAGQKIRSLEKDFSGAAASIREADLLLFAYPVYTFIVPSQLHRFIELMKEQVPGIEGKYASQISTSKHFYDVTAHRFIEENCKDMGLRVVKGLSADMEDLLSKKGQKEAESFFSYLEWSVKYGISEPPALQASVPQHKRVSAAEPVVKKPGTVALVIDLAADDRQLKAMADRFAARIPYEVRLVNIHDFAFRGGCISCFNCAVDGTCIYKDGFQELLRNEIQTCDAIVLGFSIKDHSMGSIFKMYDDRQFCNGHRTVTMGKPFGYLISGDYSKERNLQMIVEARAEAGGNFLAGVASDEFDPDSEIDALCKRLTYAILHKYVQPSNFLGVGGMKIFRDLIWQMQGLMKADHRFYKAHGQYDFPQKKRGTMLAMYLVGGMMSSPKIKSKMGNKMTEGMLMPYKHVIEKE
ncbi:MAG: NAD(P)H-dependent oxidoreductase [Eubacteriales bacterium]|nr:NAD(P)H-dependent oxidoreductase [Eubacteriales bacterium]